MLSVNVSIGRVQNFVTLTLSQTTNFRLFQIETVCRWQFQKWWKWQKGLKTDRKHCGKRRNCLLRAISHFPTVFSKDFYCRQVKTRACLGKGERANGFIYLPIIEPGASSSPKKDAFITCMFLASTCMLVAKRWDEGNCSSISWLTSSSS